MCRSSLYDPWVATLTSNKPCPNRKACSAGGVCVQAGEVSGPYCANFRILATLCTDMPSMSGCKSYSALCAEGTAVRQCTQQPPIPG